MCRRAPWLTGSLSSPDEEDEITLLRKRLDVGGVSSLGGDCGLGSKRLAVMGKTLVVYSAM